MPAESALITIVRQRVADPPPPGTDPVKYADSYYSNALLFSLDKLNFDWGTTFATAADVVSPYYFLLIKLATIEMAQIRAAEAPSGQSGDFQGLQVPNLQVYKIPKSDADKWLALCKRLQEEYDGELKNGANSGAGDGIQEAKMVRQGLRLANMKPYPLAVALTAPEIAATVDGTDVTLSWAIVLSTYFWGYEIYRADNAAMDNAARLRSLYDNHTASYLDEGLVPGTYYYRLRLQDSSEFDSDSNVVSAVVV